MFTQSNAICGIQVQKLFSKYNYNLLPNERAIDPNRLIILYGDNGSGKTTILRLLSYLLSPNTGSGHKGIVARIPFELFRVNFNSGDYVWARRPEGEIRGSFTMGLKTYKKREKMVDFIVGAEGNIKVTDATREFLNALKRLKLDMYFLADDRSVQIIKNDKQGYLPTVSELNAEETIVYQKDLINFKDKGMTPGAQAKGKLVL